MQYIFSPEKKFRTWRKLWIALAETEKELGLPITDEQIEELKAHAEDINFEEAKAREACPPRCGCPTYTLTDSSARRQKESSTSVPHPATLRHNTDLILMTEALRLVRKNSSM